MRRTLLLLLVPVLASALLVGCGDDDDETDAATDTTADAVTDGGAGNVLDVTAKEAGGRYSFETPTELEAGVVTINLTNEGQEPHQAALIRLDEGKTAEDFVAGFAEEEGPAEWIHPEGGVAAADPGGGQSNITQELEEGAYLLVCEIPGPDGKPHAANGMVAELTVEGEADDELPEADLTITAKDFAFDVPTIAAGEHTVELSNAGPADHEVVVVALQEGKKGQDVVQFFSGPPAGPPPFRSFLGGLAPTGRGRSGFLTADFEPGGYTLLCFVATPDGRPHFSLGMIRDFTVT